MKKPTIMDNLMAESIHMPGFPQIIVTRGFCYQWLTACGWSQCERGFGSLDYLVFAAPIAGYPLTDEATRDSLLAQVRHSYLRELEAA
jgi:hypothetical protein